MALSRGSGGQKYSKCMKISIRASLWFYCSYALKWNVGKVYWKEFTDCTSTRGRNKSLCEYLYKKPIIFNCTCLSLNINYNQFPILGHLFSYKITKTKQRRRTPYLASLLERKFYVGSELGREILLIYNYS